MKIYFLNSNIFRQCKAASFSVIMFWTSLGSLVMASIGLYTLNNNNDDEVIRAGREIPDNINENSLDMNMNITSDLYDMSPSRIFSGSREWLVSTLVSVLGVFSTAIIIKSLQYLHPGRVSLLQTTQILTTYILVTSMTKMTASTHGLELLDLGGVILVILTIIAALLEDKIIDTKRWKWF